MKEALQRAVLQKSKSVGLGDAESLHVETAADRFGRTVFNSEKNMIALDSQGRMNWFFPNRWIGVHGSHNVPLPEAGVMQGNLFFLGMAPLDEQADVFMLNGNHGRYFILSSDGTYLDEMFRDVRMGGKRDAQYIGGEPLATASENLRTGNIVCLPAAMVTGYTASTDYSR